MLLTILERRERGSSSSFTNERGRETHVHFSTYIPHAQLQPTNLTNRDHSPALEITPAHYVSSRLLIRHHCMSSLRGLHYLQSKRSHQLPSYRRARLERLHAVIEGTQPHLTASQSTRTCGMMAYPVGRHSCACSWGSGTTHNWPRRNNMTHCFFLEDPTDYWKFIPVFVSVTFSRSLTSDLALRRLAWPTS